MPKQPPTLEPLNQTEIAKRQAIQILQQTIQDLCLRRDALIATLEAQPKRKKGPLMLNGKEVKRIPMVIA